MAAAVLRLHDQARDRLLPTTVYVPKSGTNAPLIVFGHGMWGHPRKFRRLFARWAEAGYVVAAPAFPHTNDENPPPYLIDDVVNQPADVSFVLDELLARGLGDAGRVGVGGYSLGAETALAVGLHPRYADRRVRAVVAVAGALSHPDFAGNVLRPLPLLLVHGAEDTKRGRLREALKVYEAAQDPKQLVTIEGAGHRICQDDGLPHAVRVAELTTAFWNRYLPERDSPFQRSSAGQVGFGRPCRDDRKP
jgi:predicted dienelactone hydrolase